MAVALLCVLNLARQAPLHQFHTLRANYTFQPEDMTAISGLSMDITQIGFGSMPDATEEPTKDSEQSASSAPPSSPARPVLLLLQIPGCESERLLQQLFEPMLSLFTPAVAPSSAVSGSNASQNASTSATTLCRVGGQRWRDRCFADDGRLRPHVRLVTTPHLGVRHKARGEAVLVVVLRHPLARLVAEFNARRFAEWRVAAPPRNTSLDAGADDFALPLEQARRRRPLAFAPTPSAS